MVKQIPCPTPTRAHFRSFAESIWYGFEIITLPLASLTCMRLPLACCLGDSHKQAIRAALERRKAPPVQLTRVEEPFQVKHAAQHAGTSCAPLVALPR